MPRILERRGLALAAVKVAVLALSAWFLGRIVNWTDFWRALREVSPWAMAAAVILNLLSALLMAGRWHLLILGAGHRLPFGIVAAYNFLGMFFNQILPGSVSGDVARMWCLGGKHTSWKESAGIILWDRILGLAALILTALVFLPLHYGRAMGGGTAAAVWGWLLLAFVFFLSLQHRGLLGLVERAGLLAWRKLRPGRESAAAGLFLGLRKFLTDRPLMLKSILISLVVRVMWLLGAWILSLSMGLAVPLSYFFFFIPLIELVRMIPVSIQGLGIRELAFVFFLRPLGVSAAEATVLSLLFFTALTLAGLIGGLLYAGRRFWGVTA